MNHILTRHTPVTIALPNDGLSINVLRWRTECFYQTFIATDEFRADAVSFSSYLGYMCDRARHEVTQHGYTAFPGPIFVREWYGYRKAFSEEDYYKSRRMAKFLITVDCYQVEVGCAV